jgi:hypothetical protein
MGSAGLSGSELTFALPALAIGGPEDSVSLALEFTNCGVVGALVSGMWVLLCVGSAAMDAGNEMSSATAVAHLSTGFTSAAHSHLDM